MHAVSYQELILEAGELLPSRETLDFIHVNVADVWASNTAAAVNAGSVFAIAAAEANQLVVVSQS
jgi:hypothetical protein